MVKKQTRNVIVTLIILILLATIGIMQFTTFDFSFSLPDRFEFKLGTTDDLTCNKQSICKSEKVINFDSYRLELFIITQASIPGQAFVNNAYKADLYFQDQLIYQERGPFSGGYTQEKFTLFLTSGGSVVENQAEADYFLEFGQFTTLNPTGTAWEYKGSVFLVLQEDNFVWEQILPENVVYTEDKAFVTIMLVNNEEVVLTGVLTSEYTIPTVIGNVTDTFSENVVINIGDNIYEVAIPTTQVTDTIQITPQLDIFYNFGNTKFLTGKIQGDPQIIEIRPVEERELIAAGVEIISLEEKLRLAQLTSEQLALEIQETTNIIEEQGLILKQVNLTLQENSATILALYSELDNQAAIISAQQNTISENIMIIQDLYNDFNKQLQIIEELTRTQAEKDEYIGELLTNIVSQDFKIQELSSIIEININQIINMNATIQEQLNIIKNVNANIEEKELLIIELRDSLELEGEKVSFMLEAIHELELENDNIKNLLNNYQSTIKEDSVLITSLRLENEELKELVSGYKDNLDLEQQLVQELQLENEQLVIIIKDYEQRLYEQQQLSNELLESNQNLNIKIAQLLTNQITLEELTTELQLSNEEMQVLIKEYLDRLSSMADYITNLELNNNELQLLLKSISNDSDYLQQLLTEIDQKQQNKQKSLLTTSVIILIIGTVLGIFVLNNRGKKRK